MPNPNYPATERERLAEHLAETITEAVYGLDSFVTKRLSLLDDMMHRYVMLTDGDIGVLDEPDADLQEALADFRAAVERALES